MSASLASFFIYSDVLGNTEETEEEKVLFYWPDVPRDERLMQVGICQGLVGLTRCVVVQVAVVCSDSVRELAGSELCSFIRTDKHRYGLISPDPDFWMVIVRFMSLYLSH